MDFKPLTNRVIVVKDKPQEKTAGGIIMADPSRQVITQGFVLATGPDVKELKPGDRVLFGPRAGTAVSILGEELHMFLEDDIYGVFVE